MLSLPKANLLQNTHTSVGIHSAILCLLVTLAILGKQVLRGISTSRHVRYGHSGVAYCRRTLQSNRTTHSSTPSSGSPLPHCIAYFCGAQAHQLVSPGWALRRP
jgi:hypothetical protein